MIRILILVLGFSTVILATPEYPKLGPDIYDPQSNGAALIESAVSKAGTEHKNVLLMFGANWCIWCHRLHATLQDNAELVKLLHDNYEFVMVDVNKRHGTARNAEIDARYGNPTKLGLPVLVVLDSSGKQLTTQDSGDFESGKEAHDPAKVAAFLKKWAPSS